MRIMIDKTANDKAMNEFGLNIMAAILNYVLEVGMDEALSRYKDYPRDTLSCFKYLEEAVNERYPLDKNH